MLSQGYVQGAREHGQRQGAAKPQVWSWSVPSLLSMYNTVTEPWVGGNFVGFFLGGLVVYWQSSVHTYVNE